MEGKGNGIKTVIPNMFEIGKALNRPPSCKKVQVFFGSNIQFFLDPTKFFGCELGAQVICDEKNNRYIVNGCHEAYRLQEILDGFINKFVLCPSCKNPETDLVTIEMKIYLFPVNYTCCLGHLQGFYNFYDL